MALISCPECGKQVSDRAVSCPNCGCPISAVPAAPVQQNPAEDLNNLLALARRARTGNDGKNAKRYYDQVLFKAPGNWEAMFYSVYFEAAECRIMDIAPAANSVANSIYGTFCAIKDLKSEAEKESALNEVIASATKIAYMFASAATAHYEKFFTRENALAMHNETQPRMTATIKIFQETEAQLNKVFPQKGSLLREFQKTYWKFLNISSYGCWGTTTEKDRLKRLEIRESTPIYSSTSAPISTDFSGSPRDRFEKKLDDVITLLDSDLVPAIEIGLETFEKIKNDSNYTNPAYASSIEQAKARVTALIQHGQKVQQDIESLKQQYTERKKQILELNEARTKLGLMKQKQKKEIDEQIAACEAANNDAVKKIKTLRKAFDADVSLRTAPANIKRIIRSQTPETANRVCGAWDTFERTKHDFFLGVKSDGSAMKFKAQNMLACNPDISGWRDIVAIKTVGYTLVGLNADGTVVTATGSRTTRARELSGQKNIVAISASRNSAIGLRKDGTVIVSEDPDTRIPKLSACAYWKDIVAISMHDIGAEGIAVIGLKSDGTVVATGPNDYKQCDVFRWNNIVAVSTSGRHTIGLRSDGTVLATGLNRYGECNVSEWTDIIAIDTTTNITIGLKADGSVVVCGQIPANWNEKLSSWRDIIAVKISPCEVIGTKVLPREIFGLKADGTIAHIIEGDAKTATNSIAVIRSIKDIRIPK